MEFICNTKKFTIIPLSSLIFDEKVADMVDQNNVTFPNYLMNNISSYPTFKLDQTRLNRVLDGYNIALPAIKVVRTLGGKYSVENGRHRVCATIIKGCDRIACEIV